MVIPQANQIQGIATKVEHDQKMADRQSDYMRKLAEQKPSEGERPLPVVTPEVGKRIAGLISVMCNCAGAMDHASSTQLIALEKELCEAEESLRALGVPV